MLNTIEEDEKIIKLLEEIDESFSSIKVTLRELKIKTGRLSQKNKEIVSDCSPWINFFETRVDFSPLSELNLQYNQNTNSPSNLNYSTPRNPFVEAESSELLNNRNICHNSSSSCVDLENNVKLDSSARESPDSEETELVPFQPDLLPSIFQKETDLFHLYEFIEKHRSVAVEEIVENFKEISHEKIEILVSLLCRKNFVKQKNSKITVEK